MTSLPRRPTWEQARAAASEAAGADLEVVCAVEEGAYSFAGRWIVRTPGGARAFVKAVLDDEPGHGIAVEHGVYATLGLGFHPRLVGWHPGQSDEGVPAVLVLEDLADAAWGAPLDDDAVDALDRALAQIEAVESPLAARCANPGSWPTPWAALVDDAAPLVASGIVDAAWAELALSALLEAAGRVDPCGDGLVHGDLWLQNWCRASRGAVLVDWTGARLGNPAINRAWGECGVRAAGGPAGRICRTGREDTAAWSAWMAGQAAAFHVGTLAREGPALRPRLVETERRELLAALAWTCDELGLAHPQPDPSVVPPPHWRP